MRNIIGLVALACLGLALVQGCGGSSVATMAFPLSPETEAIENAEARSVIAGALEELFGRPGSPRRPDESPSYGVESDYEIESGLDLDLVRAGFEHYRFQCMHCHGFAGNGDGPTAAYLNPRPRNFHHGKFKFTSTASGMKPTRADLMRTLRQGIWGTYMPSFSFLDEADLRALVEYVVYLTMRGELELFLTTDYKDGREIDDDTVGEWLEVVVEAWNEAEDAVVVAETPKPRFSPESLARGDELFHSPNLQCVACHGELGKGDGQKEQVDEWGFPTRPADLTRGVYRGGRRPIDLYRRIYAGIKGTPMPAFAGTLPSEDIWHVVHYVQSLGLSAAGQAAAGGR